MFVDILGHTFKLPSNVVKTVARKLQVVPRTTSDSNSKLEGGKNESASESRLKGSCAMDLNIPLHASSGYRSATVHDSNKRGTFKCITVAADAVYCEDFVCASTRVG